MQLSYGQDPDLSPAVFALLEQVFPGLEKAAAQMRAWEAVWEAVSTPYLVYEGSRVVAHVGVIDLPLIVQGRRVRAGSVHAVATHPDRRRQGLYRRLMDEVLEAAPSRYDLLLLTTENPEYYEPFGFRYVPENRFEVDVAHQGHAGRLRPLDLADADDRLLLRRLVQQRTPVSRVVGIADAHQNDAGYTVFCFNEGFRTLLYAEELNVALALQVTGTQLDLFDVAGPALPSVEQLLSVIASPIDRIRFHFTPDRICPQARAIRHVPDYGGPSYLMVRGRFAAETGPFALPRTART